MAQDAWAKEDFAECFADFRVELCLCRLLRPSTFSVVVVVVVRFRTIAFTCFGFMLSAGFAGLQLLL